MCARARRGGGKCRLHYQLHDVAECRRYRAGLDPEKEMQNSACLDNDWPWRVPLADWRNLGAPTSCRNHKLLSQSFQAAFQLPGVLDTANWLHQSDKRIWFSVPRGCVRAQTDIAVDTTHIIMNAYIPTCPKASAWCSDSPGFKCAFWNMLFQF